MNGDMWKKMKGLLTKMEARGVLAAGPYADVDEFLATLRTPMAWKKLLDRARSPMQMAREELGWTQPVGAWHLDVAPISLCGWESGRRPVPIERWPQVDEVLGHGVAEKQWRWFSGEWERGKQYLFSLEKMKWVKDAN
jgi:hypothetical protein